MRSIVLSSFFFHTLLRPDLICNPVAPTGLAVFSLTGSVASASSAASLSTAGVFTCDAFPHAVLLHAVSLDGRSHAAARRNRCRDASDDTSFSSLLMLLIVSRCFACSTRVYRVRHGGCLVTLGDSFSLDLDFKFEISLLLRHRIVGQHHLLSSDMMQTLQLGLDVPSKPQYFSIQRQHCSSLSKFCERAIQGFSLLPPF